MLIPRTFEVADVGKDVKQPVLEIIWMEGDRERLRLFSFAGGEPQNLDFLFRLGIVFERPDDGFGILHHEQAISPRLGHEIDGVVELVLGKGPLELIGMWRLGAPDDVRRRPGDAAG